MYCFFSYISFDRSYNNIIDACYLTTNDVIPCSNFSISRDKHNHFTGCTTELNLSRVQSLFRLLMWDTRAMSWEGEVTGVMRHARNNIII